MIALRKFVTSLLVLALLFAEACNKKKPVLPPQSLAPTVAVELPAEIPEIPEAPAPEVVQTPVEPPPVRTNPKRTTHSGAKKTAPPVTAPAAEVSPPSANNNPPVATLRPPPDTAIAAAVSSERIISYKKDTARIVDDTENTLKNISRPLSDDEKSMKAQIQSYLQQSRKATNDGDFERALNLAKKAQLLADALVKK